MEQNIPQAWVVTANMGYGHQRASFPLLPIAKNKIQTVGRNSSASEKERRLWEKTLWMYEFISRSNDIPIVGKYIFKMLDMLLDIPSFYPKRNQSSPTAQVKILEYSIAKGLCADMLSQIKHDESLPLISSFYAPVIAAEMSNFPRIFCIICDADLNRVWVSKKPQSTKIEYFAPCGMAYERLRSYGVPISNIHMTGFPLPLELIGDRMLSTLKYDLGQRLNYLDPRNRFRPLHGINVEHFIGRENYEFRNERCLNLTYAVGGAGAQRNFAKRIIKSLQKKIENGEIKINLVAGIRPEIFEYFFEIKQKYAPNSSNIEIVFEQDIYSYFDKFNSILRNTDILWTKPSELSFYAGLGIPIIMSPTIGAQERYNRRWLFEMGAGIKMQAPELTDQWLFDLLKGGRLAEAAWAGFLKIRKMGTYKIIDYIQNGSFDKSDSPLFF